jgi:hypothetical protein
MRDWVMMFNAPGQGGPHDRKASGQHIAIMSQAVV